jgi:homopolymeric O-antigen transport system ATP-binding protein
MRLGFAVAANVDAEILLVDEVLAVGDLAFQQKCIERVKEIRHRGVSTIFVSHDFGAVRTLCDEAALLHRGRIIERGTPAQVLERYNALIAGHGEDDVRAERRAGETRRYGTGAATIESVELLDVNGRALQAVVCGDTIEIRVRLAFHAPIRRPTVGILIRDRFGADAFGTNTFLHEIDTGDYEAGEAATVSFRMRLDLGPADYSVAASVHTRDSHVYDCYDWIDRCLQVRVLPPALHRSVGSAYLQARITVQREAADEPPPRSFASA